MDTRFYFILGDLISNALTGAAAAVVAALMISESWWMLPAMLAAMVVGMVVGLLLIVLVLMPLFGAMEIMVPCMFSGMLGGMVVGMLESHTTLELANVIYHGVGTGLFVLVITWIINSRLRRRDAHAG